MAILNFILMSRINSTLATLLPFLPRWVARPFANPYVAGESVESALQTVQLLNKQGYLATLDILGEHTHDQALAATIRDRYRNLLDQIADQQLKCSISLKLTHIGLDIAPEIALENTLSILRKAEETENFLRLDMENSPYTDQTIQIYQEGLKTSPRIGLALQAYLMRTLDDIRQLISPQFNCRICKGIYRESSSIAFQDKEEIRENFINLVQYILTLEGFVAIATHDIYLIDTLEEWIHHENIDPQRLEFQVLYGVPMGNRLRQLLAHGFSIRVYVPFGADWFDYSIRRLKENPDILGYIVKNLFKQGEHGYE
jgi:proline dehydrogenase